MPGPDAATLRSPGATIAFQAAQERLITLAAENATRSYLRTIARRATDYSLPITATYVHDRWQDALDAHLAAVPSLDDEARRYLALRMTDDGALSDVVWDAVTWMAVQAQSTALSREEHEAALIAVLDPETGDPALTAAGFWDRLPKTGSSWISRVRRDVRTGATGLYGSVSMRAMRALGFPQKRWVTRHDDRVRSSHDAADGQTVSVESPFMVGGTALMYPGERGGAYAEVVNCRCVMVGV
jgi:hypothetical protein